MSDYNFGDDSADPAFQETLRRATAGELIAARRMLNYYFEGTLVERDLVKAEYWAARMREHDFGPSDEEQAHIPMI